MSAAEKVEHAAAARKDFGLNLTLKTLGLAKATWYYSQRLKQDYVAKYAHLRDALEAIARDHPEYGYRRTTVELRERLHTAINHKVVQKLQKCWDLPLISHTHHPKPSGIRQVIASAGARINLLATLTDIGCLQVLHTDFTELVYANGQRKAHLIPLLDHTSKVVLGWAVAERATTELALEAWEHAKRTLQRFTRSWRGVIVHHDQDPVFTGHRWTSQLLLDDQVRVSYALNGAKGNPEMEAFNSRFKTENRSLFLDADSLNELRQVVEERIEYYNTDRRHSSIGYVAPLQYLTQALRSHLGTLKSKP